MSVEQVKAFIERAKGDAVFTNELMAMGSPGERMAYINTAGFDCTADEIRQVYAEYSSLDSQYFEKYSIAHKSHSKLLSLCITFGC